ncbi:hypothetical protein EXIGLDRAFT_86937 [Exidia glandulosa HHB12029]|uniref:Uncharacterized protein n=1 Tax=Exidia glandulosa HHB12029 TaxID=1314781 RepID=A0A165HCZ5_EXIGL|nr:hypothetical protein EXIGLDRAFT_86937 [Exidia glandulosa HHB12029]
MTLHLGSPLPSTTGSQALVDVDQDDNTLSSSVDPTAGLGLARHRVVLPVDGPIARREALHDLPLKDHVDAVASAVQDVNTAEASFGTASGHGRQSASFSVSPAARPNVYTPSESDALGCATLDTVTAPHGSTPLDAGHDLLFSDVGPVPVLTFIIGAQTPDGDNPSAHAPLSPGLAAAMFEGDALGGVPTIAALSPALSREERNHVLPSGDARVSAEAPAADDASSSVTGSASNARNCPAISAHQAVHFGPSETYMIVDVFSYNAVANGAAAQFVLPTDLAFLF